jgi:hypothetical protein
VPTAFESSCCGNLPRCWAARDELCPKIVSARHRLRRRPSRLWAHFKEDAEPSTASAEFVNLAHGETCIFNADTDHMPDLTPINEPERLRLGWLNDIKHWQVDYTDAGRPANSGGQPASVQQVATDRPDSAAQVAEACRDDIARMPIAGRTAGTHGKWQSV